MIAFYAVTVILVGFVIGFFWGFFRWLSKRANSGIDEDVIQPRASEYD